MNWHDELIRAGMYGGAGFTGALLGGWVYDRLKFHAHKREAKRLIARALGGSVVAETKPHRRTIRRK